MTDGSNCKCGKGEKCCKNKSAAIETSNQASNCSGKCITFAEYMAKHFPERANDNEVKGVKHG